MLAAAWPVEDQVAALGLRRRDRPPGVVLVARVLRDLHADACERVPGEARTVEADLARRRRRRPALGPLSVPPPQEYGTPICDPPRRITYSIACGPRTRPPRAGRGAGLPPSPMAGQELLTEALGGLQRDLADLERRVRDRDRITGRARTDDLRQRRIPRTVAGVGRGGRRSTDHHGERAQQRRERPSRGERT